MRRVTRELSSEQKRAAGYSADESFQFASYGIALWPETVKALRQAIFLRPLAMDAADDDPCLLTQKGYKLVGMIGESHADALGRNFARLLKRLKTVGRC